MSEHRYDPRAIEPKWQEVWERERTWEVSNDDVDGAEKSYVLEMLPYPSGEPHMGHLKNYSVGDAVAHFHRRTGRRVLHPMGYDAFGLPAENNAIKTGVPPRQATEESIASFQKQMRQWGISIAASVIAASAIAPFCVVCDIRIRTLVRMPDGSGATAAPR